MELGNSFNSLSGEEQKKVAFLMEAEYILQQVDNRQISISEGYQQMIKLLGEKEMDAVLDTLYQRAAS